LAGLRVDVVVLRRTVVERPLREADVVRLRLEWRTVPRPLREYDRPRLPPLANASLQKAVTISTVTIPIRL
jgi:hypothetical protein